MLKFYGLIGLLLLVFSAALIAQEDLKQNRPSYGGFLGSQFYMHSTDGFNSLANVDNCCPEFGASVGEGFSFGAHYLLPIFDKHNIGLRLGYNTMSAGFIDEEPTTLAYNNQTIDGTFEHNLTTNISRLWFEPVFQYNINLNFYAQFSAIAGLGISSSFEQREEIIQPRYNGVFQDTRTRIRNKKSGEIEEQTSLWLATGVAIGYKFPINSNQTLFASPEIGYYLNLNSNINNSEWKSNFVRAILAFNYSPMTTSTELEEISFIDTTIIDIEFNQKQRFVAGIPKINISENQVGDYKILQRKEYSRVDTLFRPLPNPKDTLPTVDITRKIISDFELSGKDEAGRNTDFDKIVIDVTLIREIYPLLPYVFFDENSFQIPNRYNKLKSASSFDENDLPPSPISYHRNILNIIAKRLIENKNVQITLKGFVDPTTEAENCELAKKRAEAVKSYLIAVGAPENRITIETATRRCYPKDLTRTKSYEGFAENRRVEIETNVPATLFAVASARYHNPDRIYPFAIEMIPNDKIEEQKYFQYAFDKQKNRIEVATEEATKWTLEVKQGSTILLKEEGLGQATRTPLIFDKQNTRKLIANVPLELSLSIFDKDGTYNTENKRILVEKDTADLELETLTLTVFGVSQANLDDRLKKEISSFVAGLGSDASIQIIGFSDNLGNSNDNKQLSIYRADEIRKYIRSIAPNVTISKVEGVGADGFPPGVSSYNTPEERFICRTVAIVISKPVVRK